MFQSWYTCFVTYNIYCSVLRVTDHVFSFRVIYSRIYFSRHAVPPNYAMRSSRSNEKSVFRIVSYPHSGPAKLARLAKDRAAFSGEEDKLIIRNSAIAKISQLLAPTSERRVDRNIGPPRRRLLSAIPPIQKSASTLRKHKMEISPSSLSLRVSATNYP